MRNLLAVLILWLSIAGATAQVDIDSGLSPSDAITNTETAFYGWLAETLGSDTLMGPDCAREYYGPDGFSNFVIVCLLFDEDAGTYTLVALSDGEFADTIFVFYGGELDAVAFNFQQETGTSLIRRNLAQGEYEVMFSGAISEIVHKTVFWFWIE